MIYSILVAPCQISAISSDNSEFTRQNCFVLLGHVMSSCVPSIIGMTNSDFTLDVEASGTNLIQDWMDA
jgi:hypothetical protein